jgi:uncharacterized UBP type Zn finger protein
LITWGIFGVVLLIVFLLGLVPMWLQKNAVAAELAVTQKQLRKSEIKGLLTTAIVEANHGEYEPARKDASEFFSQLLAEIDKGEESALTKEERDKLATLFVNRDAAITMLAQRDQASTERLTDIYVIYQQVVGPSIAPVPETSTSPQPTQ